MKFIWRCHICIDAGESPTEAAAARAWFNHYCTHHYKEDAA